MAMKTFETEFKASDGIRIVARGWEPDVRPLKAVICLVHGIGEHSGRYPHVAEAFCRQDYAFFAPDMRGHGRSEGVKGHLPASETIVNDIDGYLKEVRKRYPDIPVFLFGHSLGGIFVLYYGLKKPRNLAGVISQAPGLRNTLQDQPLKVLAAKVLGTLMPRMTISTGLDVMAISRDRSVVEEYIRDPLVHDKMSVGFGKVMLEVIPWIMTHAGEWALPLLLMHGKKDTIGFFSGSEAFAASLDGQCTLVIWEEAYHELHNEPEKEQVIQTMTDWVGKQL